MGTPEAKRRRAYGAGSLLIHTCADGQEVWYGRWYVGKRRLSRRIGTKRRRGTGKGLTHTEADAELRRMMLSERAPRRGSALPFAAAAEQMLPYLEASGRRPTTLETYRAILRAHLLPRFGEMEVDHLRQDQIESFATDLLRKGLAAQTARQRSQAPLADPDFRPETRLVPGECLRAGSTPARAPEH